MDSIRFDLHPLIGEDEYIIENYIVGLINLALCDSDINSEEQKFIDKIANAVGLTSERLETIKYTDFGKNLDVLKFDFYNKKIQHTFFCDLIILSMMDGTIDDEEFDFIGALVEEVNLDERVFQYILRVADSVYKNNDNAYLLTILSRHKDVDFKQFQFYFGNILNDSVRDKVKRLKAAIKQLEKLKSIYMNIDYDDISDITDSFTEENNELLYGIVDDIEDIRHEVESEVKQFITFSDEDIYWDLEEIIHEIYHLSDMLMVNVGSLVLSSMGIEGLEDYCNDDRDFKEDGEKLISEIDKALKYLHEFDNYERLVKQLGE